MPSFSIDLLPAEAFEALLLVVGWIGEVLVDDPPYLLDAHLYEPAECWCRIELLPEAGASTVRLTVIGPEGEDAPPVDDVRDVLVACLHQLGRWARLTSARRRPSRPMPASAGVLDGGRGAAALSEAVAHGAPDALGRG